MRVANEKKWYRVDIDKIERETQYVCAANPESAKRVALRRVEDGWKFDEVKPTRVRRYYPTEGLIVKVVKVKGE